MVADALCRRTKTHDFDFGFSRQIRKTLWQARWDGSKGRYGFKKKIGVGLSQMRGVKRGGILVSLLYGWHNPDYTCQNRL